MNLHRKSLKKRDLFPVCLEGRENGLSKLLESHQRPPSPRNTGSTFKKHVSQSGPAKVRTFGPTCTFDPPRRGIIFHCFSRDGSGVTAKINFLPCDWRESGRGGENRGRGGCRRCRPEEEGNLQPTALFDQFMASFVLHSPTFFGGGWEGGGGEKRGL